LSTAIATHPQQYVEYCGEPTPIERVAELVFDSSRGDQAQRTDQTFRFLGRRMNLIMPKPIELAALPGTDERIKRLQRQFDNCCKIAVKR
jgi:hypothetical protein